MGDHPILSIKIDGIPARFTAGWMSTLEDVVESNLNKLRGNNE